MRAILSATLVAGLLLCAAVPAAAAPPALRCTAPDGVTRFKVALPHTAGAIRIPTLPGWPRNCDAVGPAWP